MFGMRWRTAPVFQACRCLPHVKQLLLCWLPGNDFFPTLLFAASTPRPQIVYDMEQVGVEPTAYTYTLLLDCLAQRSKAFDGFQVSRMLYS